MAATWQLFPVIILALVALGLGTLYGAVYVMLGQDFFVPINQFGPFLLLGMCGWAAYELVRRSNLALWSPMPWFLFACGAYYGLGPLAYHFATPESVAYINTDFPADERWLLRTNLLNAIGVGTICSVMAVASVLLPHCTESRLPGENDSTEQVMWFFLIVGGTVKYLLALPHALGLLSWTLPGSVQHLAGLVSATIVLLFVLIHRGRKKYRTLLFLVVACEFVAGLMTFSKFEIIMTVLAILLGRFLCGANLRAFVVGGLLIAISYALVLSPFVSFARLAAGGLGVSDVNDLQDTVEEYNRVGKDAMATLQPGVQGWWTRLCYTPVQAFVMDSYDSGGSGESFALLPYVFIPRFLSDDKPIMTTGRELTKMLTGDDSLGHTGVGVFGEAYWNGGWIMVVTVCAYIGVIFALFTRFSTSMVAEGRYVYMPLIQIGIVLGLRPDDWFVPTYVGSIVEVGALYLLLTVLIFGLRWWPAGPSFPQQAPHPG